MPDYRLYELQADGDRAQPPHGFFATSDEVAIRHAQTQACPEGCELWEGERFVAAIGSRRGGPAPRNTGAPA